MGKKTPGGAGTHTGHTSARTRTHGSHSHRRTGTGTEVKWHAHKHNDAWMSAIEGTVKGAPFGVADSRATTVHCRAVRRLARAQVQVRSRVGDARSARRPVPGSTGPDDRNGFSKTEMRSSADTVLRRGATVRRDMPRNMRAEMRAGCTI